MIDLNIKSNAKWTNPENNESIYVIAIGGLGDLLIREIVQKEMSNDINYLLVSFITKQRNVLILLF